MEKVERGIPRVVVDAVNALDAGTATVRQQDPEFGTYFSKREPGDEWIDWERSSYEIYNKIRAITAPGPGARTMLKSRELVLWSARYQKDWPTYTAIPGQVVGQEPDGVRVKTGDSTIVVTSVQFDDETPTTPALRIGTRLGVNLRRVVRDLRSEVKELRREVARLSQETD
jgi:methionyl-tRNA formyltransferase